MDDLEQWLTDNRENLAWHVGAPVLPDTDDVQKLLAAGAAILGLEAPNA